MPATIKKTGATCEVQVGTHPMVSVEPMHHQKERDWGCSKGFACFVFLLLFFGIFFLVWFVILHYWCPSICHDKDTGKRDNCRTLGWAFIASIILIILLIIIWWCCCKKC